MRYSMIFFVFLYSCNSKIPDKSYEYNIPELKEEIIKQINLVPGITKEDAIKDIKLYNTVLFYALTNDSLCKVFMNYFENNLDKIKAPLRCDFGLGMATVCEDSLNIGSYYNRKSIFLLDIDPPKDGRARILNDSLEVDDANQK